MTPLRHDDAAVLEAISAAADAGQKCPSNYDLCDLIGANSTSRVVDIMARLQKRGLIRVERFSYARRVTIVATGKATVHNGSTAPHWRDAGARPVKQRVAPPSLRPAPPILTPRAADMFIQLADHLGGAVATNKQAETEKHTRALTLREVVEREVAEAAERRSHAYSNGCMFDPFPVAHPTPVLAAPALTADDSRPIADSREPCPRCQTRGDLGCAHQRPFIANQHHGVGND